MASPFKPPFSDYGTADKFLGGKEQKKVSWNSALVRINDNCIALRLYSTDIVQYMRNGMILLNTGGYNTVTTRRYMNGAQKVAHVSQNNGKLHLVSHYINGNAQNDRLWNGEPIVVKEAY